MINYINLSLNIPFNNTFLTLYMCNPIYCTVLGIKLRSIYAKCTTIFDIEKVFFKYVYIMQSTMNTCSSWGTDTKCLAIIWFIT